MSYNLLEWSAVFVHGIHFYRFTYHTQFNSYCHKLAHLFYSTHATTFRTGLFSSLKPYPFKLLSVHQIIHLLIFRWEKRVSAQNSIVHTVTLTCWYRKYFFFMLILLCACIVSSYVIFLCQICILSTHSAVSIARQTDLATKVRSCVKFIFLQTDREGGYSPSSRIQWRLLQ